MTLMKVNQMSLIEHITELRRRLLIVAISFVVFFIAGFFSEACYRLSARD